ncbi:MAG: type IX secretion system protein PorQ [Bacteroidetes bacterium]|nr:type IX secretion system protein PorQ [Bacteroidota bacterium]
MRKTLFLSLSLLITTVAVAQIGGVLTYEFMNLPVSARIAALGGQQIGIKENDLNLAYLNPSLYSLETDRQMTFNTSLYFSGINYGYFGFGHQLDKWKTSAGYGVQFIHYGVMEGRDAMGQTTANFVPGEYVVHAGGSRSYANYTYGANLKIIHSVLESYTSFGVAMDFAGMVVDSNRDLNATIVVKNIGTQLTTYVPGNREPIPFEIQAGFSKYLPFRLSVTLHNLQTFDIRYNDPNEAPEITFTVDSTEGPPKEKKYIADKLFRHFIFGGEMLLSDNFNIMIGYNHMRRKELTTESLRGLAGFSGGVMIRIKKFRISYSRSWYFVRGGANHFSITTNLIYFTHNK